MSIPPPPAALNTAGKLFFGSLCAGTFGLGCWQTQRLLQKQQLVEQRAKELSMEPLKYYANSLVNDETHDSIAGTTNSKKSKESFRRYSLTGTFLHHKEFLVGPRGPPAGALGHAPGSSAKGLSSAPQGYYVVTPLQLLDEKHDNGANDDANKQTASKWTSWFRTTKVQPYREMAAATLSNDNYVLVNRGWVPRNLVADDARRQQRHVQQPSPDLLQWDRPTGNVQVVGVVTETEHPKYLVADHDISSKPPKLYWFDAPTMKAVGNVPLSAPYFTAVRPTSDKITGSSSSLPLAPTADQIGEFKVTPAVHVGYAVTWFGLSAAGMVMTRKLILKGR
ncbi:hypothetical protein MPSEU_000054700 [Mayamaea pseudoterrestris]|nr:hypothetical protein MPSEU_000054700 [Mayamaea pseudoterrestris]